MCRVPGLCLYGVIVYCVPCTLYPCLCLWRDCLCVCVCRVGTVLPFLGGVVQLAHAAAISQTKWSPKVKRAAKDDTPARDRASVSERPSVTERPERPASMVMSADEEDAVDFDVFVAESKQGYLFR